MTDRGGAPPAQAPLLDRVRLEIERRGLSDAAVAEQIGVNVNTLKKHLRGEHVRSDSALKYQDWLEGRLSRPRLLFSGSLAVAPPGEALSAVEQAPPPLPPEPYLVADIFAGCGGLSLGFDLLDGGRRFRTVIALDVEDAPISVLNGNASRRRESTDIGRHVDLTDFMNEAEFLAFYVAHAADVFEDGSVLRELDELAGGVFPIFRASIAAADAAFLTALRQIRALPAWREALAGLDRESLGQTSVAAFHTRLRLPRTGTRPPSLPNILWNLEEMVSVPNTPGPQPSADLCAEAEAEWAAEASVLTSKREASGRGQLKASARRVSSFADLLSTEVFDQVRAAWVRWRATRLMLREGLFANEEFCTELRKVYEKTFPISVLVGGPPCQGFSRIGRGKIRSLREALVHAHSDAEAGDARNLLFQQYVMIVGALRPKLFLFENVQHFQSTVSADGGDFHATEVLEEAVRNVSDGQSSYAVSSVVLNAARYGVPQNRLRYFMCGVRSDGLGEELARDLAKTCLSLPESPELPLKVALDGLPEPVALAASESSSAAMSKAIRLIGGRDDGAESLFSVWVRQPAPGKQRSPRVVDGHVARTARSDDARLFALMGPGRRWMDYRADESETVKTLKDLLSSLTHLPSGIYSTLQDQTKRTGTELPDQRAIQQLSERIDGSLPLRLLLEQITAELGFRHHLLKESYLAKRDGSHGDWLAKMDPDRPAKTMVSHMSKDTYGFVHPYAARTLSVREAARIQTFPDWFTFSDASLTEAFKMIGNAVPPLLSHHLAVRVASVLAKLNAGDKIRTTATASIVAV